MRYKTVLRIFVGILFPIVIVATVAWAKLVKAPLPCILYTVTGLYCPMCGGTRAVISLLNGDIFSALKNNLFVTLVTVPTVLFASRLWVGFVFDRPALYRIGKKTLFALCVFVVCFIAFGILRNIPCRPFIYFTPVK